MPHCSAACCRGTSSRTRDIASRRRACAGSSLAQAAARNCPDVRSLRDWVHRYNATGVAGLRSRTSPGRAPLLTPEQKAELRALVLAGPDPERHRVVRWRCVDLRGEIVRRFGVEVHESTVAEWLHQLGLTRLQPRPYHPKKDAAAQEAYKKTA